MEPRLIFWVLMAARIGYSHVVGQQHKFRLQTPIWIQTSCNSVTILSSAGVFCHSARSARVSRLRDAVMGGKLHLRARRAPRQFPIQSRRRANSKYTCERKYKLGIAARLLLIQMLRADNERFDLR
jgi:hypothetical protein